MKDDNITLIELQGMIASCAIENKEHDTAYKRITKLISEYGPFSTINSKHIRLLYAKQEGE
jgi:hypothetical protein